MGLNRFIKIIESSMEGSFSELFVIDLSKSGSFDIKSLFHRKLAVRKISPILTITGQSVQSLVLLA